MVNSKVGRVHYLTGRCLHLGAGYACTIAGAAFCLAKPLAELLYPGPQTGHYLQLFAPLLVLLYLDAIVDAFEAVCQTPVVRV